MVKSLGLDRLPGLEVSCQLLSLLWHLSACFLACCGCLLGQAPLCLAHSWLLAGNVHLVPGAGARAGGRKLWEAFLPVSTPVSLSQSQRETEENDVEVKLGQ